EQEEQPTHALAGEGEHHRADDQQDREPRRGALQPWKDGPESPAAHRTHGKRSLRPGTATQPPGGPGRLPAPRGGFPVPVEEGDGQAVELLIGALGDHSVHHLDPRIVAEPLGDGVPHGLAVPGERRREHLHSAERSVGHAPPSYIQSGAASNAIEKLQRACPAGQTTGLFPAAWPDAVRMGAQRGPVGLLRATEDAVALPLPPLGPPLLGDLLRPLPRGPRPLHGHPAVPLAGIDNTPCPRGGPPMMLEAAFSMLPSRVCWALVALAASALPGCGPAAAPETLPSAVATARSLVRPHVARNAL